MDAFSAHAGSLLALTGTPVNIIVSELAGDAGARPFGFFEFAPPEPGWPWILLCHWPRRFAQLFGADPDALARDAYSMEAFEDRDSLQSALKAHIAVFGDLASVKIIPPLPGTAGRA